MTIARPDATVERAAPAPAPGRRLRILLAKPGLDGHERGVLVVARALRDAGHEVIYSGVRQSPAAIARAAVQEDVDVLGLSILSGSHLTLVEAVIDALGREQAFDIPVIVGGTVPQADVAALEAMGVRAVFGVGTRLEDIGAWMAGA